MEVDQGEKVHLECLYWHTMGGDAHFGWASALAGIGRASGAKGPQNKGPPESFSLSVHSPRLT